MKIEQTAFGPWKDAFRLEHEGVEMIVVTEIGPRIISLRLAAGGQNILFDDSAGSLARGDWNLWGGHRFWVSPETESTYESDNAPCAVETAGADCLRATGRQERSGLQKTLEISAAPTGFTLRHILRNNGPMVQPGAIWALTCVAPRGRVVAPWGEGTPGWRTQMVRYWTGWGGGHTGDVASRQWQPRGEYFLIDPTGEEGKIGLFSEHGYLALLRADSTFIKAYDPQPGAVYPDGGCNVELYTCSHFIEMETLSPATTFLPGSETVHTERWVLSEKVIQPEDWRAAGELARR